MTTWMVRSEDGNLIPSFLADGICAIGWHEIGDPSRFDTREDFDTAIQTARRFRCGTVWVNTFMDGPTELPFGGFGQSGLGREGGPWGLDEYLEIKYITLAGIDR